MELPSCVWAGHYEQHGRHWPQKLTLEFADGLIRGDGVDGIGPFTVDGEYRVNEDGAVRLGWIKTYELAHSVLYTGTLDSGRIVGEWSLPGAVGLFALEPTHTLGV